MIKVIPTQNGGTYDVSKNDIALDDSLYTEIYLSLFGGNVEASTERDKPPADEQSLDWWGNIYTSGKSDNPYNSIFEKTLIEVTATSSGLRKYEAAAVADLQWLVDKRVAKKISAYARIAENGTVIVAIQIDGNDKYSVTWERTKNTIQMIEVI